MKIGPLNLSLPKFSFKPVEDAAKAVGNELGHAKDEFVQEAARAVGYAELVGLKYPVNHYSEQVSPTLTRGSRLENEADYQKLKDEGFKSMVDLTKEGTADEKYAQQNGLKLERIPIIDNTAPTTAQMKTFLDFVTKPENQPAYVHCEAGQGRTGVAVACYRMAVQGYTLDQAIADGKRHGLQLEDQLEFLQNFDKALTAGQIEGYSR